MIATRARVCLVVVAAAAAFAVAWLHDASRAPRAAPSVAWHAPLCTSEAPVCAAQHLDDLAVRADIQRAVERVAVDIRGCFDEWAERHPTSDVEVRVLAAYGDDMMRVESFDAVDNDGVGACVGRAVTTVRYPPSRSVAVEVTASWTAGRLSLSARTRPYTRFPD